MLFAVRFEDHAGRAAVRSAHLDAHIAWLDRHRDVVLVGGSLRRNPGETPIGGLWIVEAESAEAVTALIAGDPFWTAGLRRSVEVLHWSKAFPERRVPV